MGHSMGGESKTRSLNGFFIHQTLKTHDILETGHGALSIYLKNPGKYRSASGLAPIWYVPRYPLPLHHFLTLTLWSSI
jgi:hypothetical protein